MMQPSNVPRGLRNNNPGNLMSGADISWLGQTGIDTNGECIFSNPLWGLRAMYKTLLRYTTHDGCTDIASIITRYAPPEGNPTDAYIHDVCEWAGLTANYEPKTLHDFALLMSGMCRQEQGIHAVPMLYALMACTMANHQEDFDQ